MVEQRLAAAVEQALAEAGSVSGRITGLVCHRTSTLGKARLPCNAVYGGNGTVMTERGFQAG
jgi:hypothetical protein